METNKLNSAGFDLYEIYPNQWMLHDKTDMRVYNGTLVEIGKFAVQTFGFELSEIEFAIKEMYKRDHNGSHFGMNRTFIFTFKKDFDAKKIS